MDNGASTACVCGEHRSANQVIPATKTLAGINLWKEIGYNLPFPCIVYNVPFLKPYQGFCHTYVCSEWEKALERTLQTEGEGLKQARLGNDGFLYR